MTKLLNCPFCGGSAIYFDENTIPSRPNPTIECDDCHCNMWELLDSQKDYLIEQWNKRSTQKFWTCISCGTYLSEKETCNCDKFDKVKDDEQ